MKKILLIQTASIGDVILITPALENLYAAFPDAAIDVLVKKGNESLFNEHPFINKLLILDKSKGKYKTLINITKQVRQQKYDAVICFQRFFTGGFITAFSNAEFKAGFSKNPFSFIFSKKIKHSIGNKQLLIHEKDRNLLLSSLLSGNKNGKIALYPSERDFKNVEKYKSKPYICIAHASLWFTKQFPVAKWSEFINNIEGDYKIYLLGSKKDEIIGNNIINLCNKKDIEMLCGKLSILESAALMKDAVMNYVNDSAPMHLASSVNANVTAIYCSTIPEFGFGPLSEKSFIIQTEEKLSCRPCGIHGHKHCPEKHFKCALTINIYNILKTLKHD